MRLAGFDVALPRRRTFGVLMGTAIVALVMGGTPEVARAVTAQQAIGYLNAERASYGIPAGIVENSKWSDGCAKHMAYVRINGRNPDNPHSEDPNKPGFTPQGHEAAGSSVLGGVWTDGDGRNPYFYAPLHYMQTMAPALSVTGYADGCLWTLPGYKRPRPVSPDLYTIPAQGSAGVLAEYAAFEWPFVPGDFVGLPQGTITGPHLYVFVLGEGLDSARISSAQLSGPTGPVEIRTVDNTTTGEKGSLGSYLPPGGIVIPVAPLAPATTYTAEVTLATPAYAQTPQTLTRAWTFETAYRENYVSVDFEDLRKQWKMTVLSTAPNPVLTLRGPQSEVTEVPVRSESDSSYEAVAEVGGGLWRACVSSGGRDVGYLPVSECFPVPGHALPPKLGPISNRRLRMQIPAFLSGRRVSLSFHRRMKICWRGRCYDKPYGTVKRTVVATFPWTTIAVPPMPRAKPRYTPVLTVAAWSQGFTSTEGVAYAGVSAARVYRFPFRRRVGQP